MSALIKLDADSEPIVALNRIHKIDTYEVQEIELDRLDELVAEENKATGFTTFAGGTFLATFLGWLATTGLSTAALAIYIGVMGCSFFVTVWSGMSWRRAAKARPRLLDTIRKRAIAKLPSATGTAT